MELFNSLNNYFTSKGLSFTWIESISREKGEMATSKFYPCWYKKLGYNHNSFAFTSFDGGEGFSSEPLNGVLEELGQEPLEWFGDSRLEYSTPLFSANVAQIIVR